MTRMILQIAMGVHPICIAVAIWSGAAFAADLIRNGFGLVSCRCVILEDVQDELV
jgi:hypothetical protein